MPFYRCELQTPLGAQAVLRRLEAVVGEKPGFFKSFKFPSASRTPTGPAFLGKIEGSVFRIERVIQHENSFLPLIAGVVTPTASGTTVSVTMRLRLDVAAFLLLCVGLVTNATFAALSSGAGRLVDVLGCAGLLVFVVALTTGAFYPEAVKARRLLEEAIAVDASSQQVH